MKNVFFFPILFASAFILASCASSQEQMDSKTDAIMGSYLEVKDALYKGDPKIVTLKADAMLKHLDTYSPSDTAGWSDVSAEMRATLRDMLMAKEISDQRVDFERLSTMLYENMDKYQFSSGRLYRAFCPMAFDNKGAYWLSDKEEIENPYYGENSDMPNCGEVRDTLGGE
jgi:membrane fusion protein, copper/silver efflux system